MGRSRHLELEHLWVQDQVRADDPRVDWIPIGENPAYVLTHPTTKSQLQRTPRKVRADGNTSALPLRSLRRCGGGVGGGGCVVVAVAVVVVGGVCVCGVVWHAEPPHVDSQTPPPPSRVYIQNSTGSKRQLVLTPSLSLQIRLPQITFGMSHSVSPPTTCRDQNACNRRIRQRPSPADTKGRLISQVHPHHPTSPPSPHAPLSTTETHLLKLKLFSKQWRFRTVSGDGNLNIAMLWAFLK